MRQTLLQQSLERVIGGVGDGHQSEDAGEHRYTVRRTAGSCGGFAEWGRILAKSHQRNRIRIRTSHGWHRTVGQVQGHARRNGTDGNRVGTVSSERTARHSRDLNQVETGLWVAVILVQDGQESVSPRTDISKLPECVSR